MRLHQSALRLTDGQSQGGPQAPGGGICYLGSRRTSAGLAVASLQSVEGLTFGGLVLFLLLLSLLLPGGMARAVGTPPVDYLGAVEEAEAALTAPVVDPDDPGAALLGADRMAHSEYAFKLALVGRYDEAVAVFNQSNEPPLIHASVPPPAAMADAIDGLARLARDHRVVFINEAHHMPVHRAFTQRLLVRLRTLGFTHFAAEGFSPNARRAGASRYPLRSPFGVLTDEPLYGDLRRRAVALGYQVIGYDMRPDCKAIGDVWRCVDQRERLSAQALVDQVLKDPAARLLVHVGYGHGSRHADDKGRSLGQYLVDMTGEMPLCIDQVRYTPQDRAAREPAEYADLLTRAQGAEPLLPLAADGSPWNAGRPGVDAWIVHPRPLMRGGRPDWLRMAGARHDRAIPTFLCGPVRPCLVQAFAADEPIETAVPVDQILVRAGEGMPVLVLPDGAFHLVARGRGGIINSLEP